MNTDVNTVVNMVVHIETNMDVPQGTLPDQTMNFQVTNPMPLRFELIHLLANQGNRMTPLDLTGGENETPC